ncbi:BRE1 [Sanghuangporus vaninii]
METQHVKSAVDDEMKMKRRASSDEWTVNKKRVLNSRMGSPVATNGSIGSPLQSVPNNEITTDEPEKEDDLERFRKAAIFRRMRYYQREYGRAYERIRLLEDSLKLAKLERIEAEACWTNTIETIRRLVQLDSFMSETDGTLKNSFPSRIFSSDDFQKTRKSSESKFRAAERAINAFIKFAGKVDRPKYEELFSECQDLQQSNAFLTAEAEETHALLERTQRDRDHYLEELRIAEAKLDRLNSQVLNPTTTQLQESNVSVKINGEVKPGAGAEMKKEDTSPVVEHSPNMSESQSDDNTEWETRLAQRDLVIKRLADEVVKLRDQSIDAHTKLRLLGEDVVAKTPTYIELLNKASRTALMLKSEQLETSKAREEIKRLQSIQATWREQLELCKTNETRQIEELKLLLKKRDDDLVRIRQQRDQLESQHKETKANYDSRRASFAKYKELAESRAERIELLLSEIRRLKSRLAAAAGDEDLLTFIQNDANVSKDYVEHVRKRLNVSEAELRSLHATLKDKERRLIDIASLQSKLESATRELSFLKQNDTNALAEKLKAKDEELRVLRLKEEQSAQEMNELFSEMDRLSKAWETADKQAQAQVISVEKWEEEKEKLSLAKQKSDNKYFKAMAELEAKEIERKQTSRHAEFLMKQIEAQEKKEKDLLVINDSLSSELSNIRGELSEISKELERSDETKDVYARKVEEEARRNTLFREEMQKRDVEYSEANQTTVKLKDELHKARKEVEKAVQRAKKSAAPTSEREIELQREAEGLMKILKCSTCQRHFRSTVILKCMHTFCKECVDARISHRQRKCPHCGLQFAQSDVQHIYFQ